MVFPEPVSPTIITTLLSLITDSSWKVGREECAVREGIYNSRGEGGGGGKGRYTLAVHVNDIANGYIYTVMSKKYPILPYPNLHVHVHLTTSTCTCTCKLM